MSVQQISAGPVVERIWEIYRDQFAVLIPTAVGLYAIQFVIYLLLPAALGLVLVLLFWALSVLYQGMVVELVQDVQDQRRDHSIPQLLRSVEPVFWPLVAVSILAGLGIFVGFVLLIVPGLFLLVIWSVVAPVTVLERPGVTAAFGRSRELVRGNGWNVFGVIVIVFLAVLVISIVAGIAASGLGSVGHALVQWVVNSLVAPFSALAASVLYFALRGQQQGVAATAAAPTAGPATTMPQSPSEPATTSVPPPTTGAPAQPQPPLGPLPPTEPQAPAEPQAPPETSPPTEPLPPPEPGGPGEPQAP